MPSHPSSPAAAAAAADTDHSPASWGHDEPPSVRLMCSFGGRIIPRPHDNQLRYVGGDTRIVAVPRSASFSSLLSKLSKLSSADFTIKYQLPNEDLDALISVTSDEDVENMMEEFDRLSAAGPTISSSRPARLRLFLFPADESGGAFGSILDGPVSSKHENWFLDALNARAPLERGRSEASSIMSEVPDYLFGLDNNSAGSPALATSSPHYGSASSAPSLPPVQDLPTEVEPEVNRDAHLEPQQGGQTGYVTNPPQGWSYVAEPAPVYYVPAGPVRQVSVPGGYMNPVQQVGYRQPVPVHGGQVYLAPQRPGYTYSVGPMTEAYEMPTPGGIMRSNSSNIGVVPMYNPAYGVPPGAGGSPTIAGSERRTGGVS